VVIQMAGQKRLDESRAIAVVDCGEHGLVPGDSRVARLVAELLRWVTERLSGDFV